MMSLNDPRAFLSSLFDAALAAADPLRCVPPMLPQTPGRRTVLIGAGKASALMAQAIEKAWPHPLEGLVVTRYGHAVPCDHVEIIEASHPVPDAAGEAAAQRILDLTQELGPEDLLICAISGGGSALLSLPGDGLTLADKQAVNKALLRSGAAIGEMNCVRKHLSAIKGGRLAAAAYPARVHTILISDVPGDDPAVIASGPTVPDNTTLAQALEILERRKIDVPDAVRIRLNQPEAETPDSENPIFQNTTTVMAARPLASLQAAADIARQAGITPLILGDALEGESRDVATVMAGIARSIRDHSLPVAAPAVLLSGGETTVTIKGDGIGGPNAEFTLALALALKGMEGVYGLACDTDGVDGAAEVAGAMIDPDTLVRAEAAGLNARAALENNDAHSFFEALGDQIKPGPTLTNVNDFRAILVV
jgi:glycerate 2-kinase